MADHSIKNSSLTGPAFWLMFAKSLAFVFSFCLPLLLVRRLDQAEFGLYKQVFLVVGTAIALLPLGFSLSAFYFLPRERERQGQVVFNILLFNATVGGLACLLLLFCPSVLASIFNDRELVRLAPRIGPVILLWILATALEAITIANGEARLATGFIIGAQFSKTALLLGAAAHSGTLEALVYAALIHGALQVTLLFLYVRSRFPGFWRDFDASLLRTQLAYAVPLGFAGLLYAVQTDLHNYFVSNRFGAATFAIYAIGCFQLPLAGILAESVNSVMIPRISYLQKQDERREIILVMARVMRKLAAVYFALYAFLLVTGREFITLLFTERYLASWPIFAVNLTLLPFAFMMFDPILRAYAEQRYFLLRMRLLLFAALLVALWLGTSRLGLVGTIAVVVAINLTDQLAVALRAVRVVGATWQDLVLVRDVGKIAVAAAAAGAATALLRSSMAAARPFEVLGACGFLFALVYAGALALLRVPTREECAALSRRVASLRQRSRWRRGAGVPASREGRAPRMAARGREGAVKKHECAVLPATGGDGA